MNVMMIAAIAAVVVVVGIVLMRRGGGKPAAPPAPSLKANTVHRPKPLTTPEPAPAAAPAFELPAELAGLTLVEEPDLPADRRERILAGLQGLSLPSTSLQELAAPDFLESGSAKELSELIMREPAVATRVLAVVNSPLYGLQSPIVSVQHAINFLGLTSVRGIAMNTLMEKAFGTDDADVRKMQLRMWDAAAIASELVHQLSQRLDIPHRGALATEALLAFIGHFAMLQLMPAGAGLANLRAGLVQRTRAEQDAVGLNATFLGALLMRNWGLPATLVDGVSNIARMLVTPPGAKPAAQDTASALCFACVRIAERIAFESLQDVELVDFRTETGADTACLRAWLELPALAKFHDHLHTPELRNSIRRMITAVGKR